MATGEENTLKGVVDKVRRISKEDYDGKTYENIQGIYNHLTGIEQTILLRGLINICFIFEDLTVVDKGSLVVLEKEVKKTEEAVHEGVSTMEDFSRKEMIKLRMFTVRFGLIMLGMLAVGGVGLCYLFGFHVLDDSNLGKAMEGILKLLETIFIG